MSQVVGEVVESFYQVIGLRVPEDDLRILTEMFERHLEAFRSVEEMTAEITPSLTFRADW